MTSLLLPHTAALEYDESCQYRQHNFRYDCLATKRSIIRVYRACSVDVKERDGHNKERETLYCIKEELILPCLTI